VAAAALGSRVLRQAADSYDRAARATYGRVPRPTPAGNSLRQAARLLATATAVTDDRTLALVTLVTRLAALAEAVGELRSAQQRAAQAAAARRAAEQLHAARGDLQMSHGFRPPAAVRVASLDTPVPLRLDQPSARRNRTASPPRYPVSAQAAQADRLTAQVRRAGPRQRLRRGSTEPTLSSNDAVAARSRRSEQGLLF
jgi:hypothetical protein